MKKYTLWSMSLLALFTACNDDYNDKFDIKHEFTDQKELSLTLAESDYATIAGNSKNKELALSKDPVNETGLKALEAVGKNKYFSPEATAEDYLPAFIDDKYPQADLKSKFTVKYKMYQAPSTYLNDFSSISTYQLTEEDYQSVWGDQVKASFLTPATINTLPSLLKNDLANAAEGDMAIVNYAYSSVEPSIGGGTPDEPEIPEVTYTPIADVIKAGAGDYTVKGTVIATNARSFLLQDNTGTILAYQNSMPTFSIGDVVVVSGTTEVRNGDLQFKSNSFSVSFVERVATFAYPSTPRELTAADMDAYLTNHPIEYVTYTGKLSVSGSYYNVLVDGTSKAQGSLQYPVNIPDNTEMNGKIVKVTGYAIGVSSSKYVNTMVTSVELADGSAPAPTPIGIITRSAKGSFTACGVVAAVYTQGFMLTDGTDDILVFKKAAPSEAVGDVVKVAGTTTTYNGVMQFGNSDLTVETLKEEGSTVMEYIKPQEFLGADLTAYAASPRPVYITIDGTLDIVVGTSYNTYNVTVEGTETKMKLSYVDDTTFDQTLSGKKVTITGYLIGVDKNGVVQMMCSKAAEAKATASTSSLTRAADVAANTAALYRFNGTDWSLYQNSDANVAVVTPDIYESLGSTSISSPETVLPTFVATKFPYAEVGQRAAVVYMKSSKDAAVMEFTLSQQGWIETPIAVEKTVVLTKSEEGITARISVYLDKTLCGDDGGFTAYDQTLTGGMSYVWTNTTSYGWKASSYYNKVNNPAESWLISPMLDFSRGEKPVMTFEEAINFLNGANMEEYCSVKVSTDFTDNVTKATWEALTLENRADGGSWTFATIKPVDLSKYIGNNNVHIAFVYKVSEGSAVAPTWEFMNILIKEIDAE